MSTKKFPEGNNTITPYLILNNASQFVEFVTEVFEAEATYKAMEEAVA